MPSLSQAILARIDELQSKLPAAGFNLENQLTDGHLQSDCIAWLVSVANLMERLIPDSTNSYRALARLKVDEANQSLYFCHACVAQVSSALNQLKADANAGLLIDLEYRVSGETFDDLLDHAAHYLKEGRPEPAAVLAGVVFEDTARRLCEKHGIEHRGKELDTIMSALKSAGVLTKLEQKEGIAAADLRGNATHANWTAFNPAQVDAVIAFARRVIRDKLAA